MTAEAQRRGDTVRRPNLAPSPLPGGRLARRVKQRSAAYASVPSRFGLPPGTPSSLVRAVDPSIEPSSDWPTATAVPLNAQYDQPCPTGGGPTSVGRRTASAAGQRPGHAPQALIGVTRIAGRAAVLSGFAAIRAGYSATAPAAGRADVKGPSPRPF